MSNTQRAGLGAQHSIAPPAMAPEPRADPSEPREPEQRRDTHVDIDIEVEFALELGVWQPPGERVDELERSSEGDALIESGGGLTAGAEEGRAQMRGGTS